MVRLKFLLLIIPLCIMDLQFLFFSILLSIVFFVLLAREVRKKSRSEYNLPPGPWKLPIIGNLHQLLSSLPHVALKDLAGRYGDLMYLRLGEVPTLVVSSAEYAEKVMKTHDLAFASRPQLLAPEILSYNTTNIAFAPYGEYWRQLRKVCVLELLSVKRVESFRPIREEEISNFIKWIQSKSGSTINLTERLTSTTYALIAKIAFSKDSGNHEEFIAVTKEVGKLSAGFNIPDVFPSIKWLHSIDTTMSKFIIAREKNDKMLNDIINDHIRAKAAPDIKSRKEYEDLVDVLLKFHEKEDGECNLSLDNIKAVILDIFVAGGETSAITVDWTMVEMMKNPRVLKKAQDEVREVFNRRGVVDEAGIAELKYLKLVVKETLRLHPPAPLLIPRESKEICEINGYYIPSKTRVLVNAWSIGRDERYWSEPEKYYPERFLDSSIKFTGNNFKYVPFGAGRRICPGMTFGIANVELPLSQLLYYIDWKLPGDMKPEDLNMSDAFGLITRRKENLFLIPTTYHP